VSVIPQTPGRGLGELTTGELARYRTQLESALAIAPDGSADHTVIQARLTGVTDEQQARSVTTGIPATWTAS
jgi:hypothetical protein